MKILITGGHGNLGTALRRCFSTSDLVVPTIEEMDITKRETYFPDDFDLIIHCAAYIDLVKAENEDKIKCYLTNVQATKWLAEFYKKGLFVYISTEYVKQPVNWYSLTKLWGENEVKKFSKNYLIIRTSFKTRPFKHPKACVNQWTTADYIDVIAPMIADKIEVQARPDWIINATVDIGTKRKTTYELALQTNPNVEPCLVEDITTVALPKDYDTSA